MAKDESCGAKHLKLFGMIIVPLLVVVIGGIISAYAAAASRASDERVDQIEARVRALEVNSEQIRTDVRWIRETMERNQKYGER